MNLLLIKIKYRLALAYRNLVFATGLGNYLLKDRYGERILVFHNIDIAGETKFNSRFVSAAYFEALIRYMKTHFNLISLEDYYAGKFKKGTLNIAITFDDGLRNNYELAVPVLEKHAVPATFFITTLHGNYDFLWPDFVDLVSFFTAKTTIDFEGSTYRKNHKKEFVSNGVSLKNKCKELEFHQIETLFALFKEDWETIRSKPLDTYWKLMDEGQIAAIAANPLFTIGSHAATHANLASIAPENAKRELIESKAKLEAATKQEITAFAFPFGTYTDDLVAFCETAGFSQLLLVDFNKDKDKQKASLKKRFVINPYIAFKHQVSCLLNDSYY